MNFNPDKYRSEIAKLQLTREQEDRFLRALWVVMENFADCAIGMHPVQMACGKLGKNARKTALTAPDGVKYDDQIFVDSFEDAVKDRVPDAVESSES